MLMNDTVRSMSRYYIVSHAAFSARDWDRFGCDEMQAAGYQVCPIVMDTALGASAAARPSIEGTIVPQTLQAAEALVGGIGPSDIVLVELRLSAATRPFFRMLRRHGVRYAAVNLGTLPGRGDPTGARSFAQRMRFHLQRTKGQVSRTRWFLHEVAANRFEYFRLQPPSIWLTAGTATSPFTAGLPMIWRAKHISVSSFDAMLADRLRQPRAATRPVAVFLDEAFADHPDYDILGVPPPVTARAYWAAMERFFQALERATSLRVMIAIHPKNRGEVPQAIRARMAERGQTAELVRDAKAVICHASTAVSFAVLFRRPLIFVTTAEIERSVYGPAIARMASWFGQQPVNADQFEAAQLALRDVDEASYRRYERAFLRAPDASELHPWEILRAEAEGLPGAVAVGRPAFAALGDR
jgi:hypothetical protein